MSNVIDRAAQPAARLMAYPKTMGRVGVFIALATLGTTLVACRGREPSAMPPTPQPSVSSSMRIPNATMPTKPLLLLVAEPSESGFVEFRVNTNLPTPLAAMASLDLHGQKPHDTAIGTSHKVTLTGAVTVFKVKAVNDDDGLHGKALPDGLYDATVIVGPRWDENKSVASLTKTLEAKQTVRFNSGRDRAALEQQNELQKWVIDNVPSNAPWNEQKYVAKLGTYQKSASSLSAPHDAYYFPNADMTLIVNRPRQEVTVWRVGRVAK